jgi:predicted MFS family arabinose efflux permease
LHNDDNRLQGSWAAILLVYCVGVIAATTVSQAISVARDITAFLHAAPTQAGWIISMPSAMTAIGAVFTGWLVDRTGDKPVLLAGCLIVILGDVGVTLSGTMPALLTMRAVEGVGYVCIAVAAVTMLMRITHGPRRNLALALWSSFIPMSFALPLILTAALAGTGAWRWAFSGHAIVLGVLTVLAILALPPREGEKGPRRTAGLSTVLRSPGPYLLGIAFALHAFIQTGIVSTLPHRLMALYHLSFPAASSVITLGMVFNVAGCLAVGPLMNRSVGAWTISVVGVAGVFIGGVTAGRELPGLEAAAAVACLFFFSSGLIAGLWSLLPHVAPGLYTLGATSGLVTQITLLGVLFGPPAAFAAQAAGGWSREGLNVTVAALVGLLLLWLVITRFSTSDPRAGGEPVQVAH